MFDVTGQDIPLLSDKACGRFGRLCEAELRRLGLSPLYATWGGIPSEFNPYAIPRASAGSAGRDLSRRLPQGAR